MLIICPSCATSYDVKPANVPPQGRQVRCARCRTVWLATPSRAEKLAAAAAAIGPSPPVSADVGAEVAHAPPVVAAAAAAAAAASSAAAASADPPAPVESDEPAVLPPVDEREDEAASFPAATGEADDARPAAPADSAAFEEPSVSALVDAPPIAPIVFDEDAPPIDVGAVDRGSPAPEPSADIESAAARRLRRTSRRVVRWPLSQLNAGILALVLIDAVLIGWRNDIVWALPQTASFYATLGLPVNLRGLAFADVATSTEQHEGVPILVVTGRIVNADRKIANVPRLKFIVRNAERQEIYAWTAAPTRRTLPPGESVSFRSRLASPPPEARDIILRFVNRRDLIAEAR